MKKSNDKALVLRVSLYLFTDIVLIQLSLLFSLLLRYEFSTEALRESGFLANCLKLSLFYTPTSILIFTTFKLYTCLWEYAGADELKNICLAVLISNICLSVFSIIPGCSLPRSAPIINCFILIALLSLTRFGFKSFFHVSKKQRQPQTPTMIIGAGSAGSLILKDLQSSKLSTNKVVCIIDDDKSKHGTYLSGVKIVGGRESIERYAKLYGITDIIIAIPTISAAEKRDIIQICQNTNCRVKTLPGIYQLASGQVSMQSVRDVQVEDLLGREKVEVDLSEIGKTLEGKTVLVTGGGGSIGSELCRQVSGFNIKKLIIFDIYENNAYEIQQELIRKHPSLDLEVCIGSVRDRERVEEIFSKYHPDFVCHAAAHKHVPLMENSPAEAIKNNIFGTYNVATAADKYSAENFILISTDKAVNPTNIMGATKRVCEMIVQTIGKTSKTKFAAVRFGNVLASNGSVIPLFRNQIREGGPVTVTHQDIYRYFMTIPEAVMLVLQACAYAKDGEIFVLDMGEPVRIADLARNMIRLSGLVPDVDIKIKFTGLRPGEKLFEELLTNDERLSMTPNKLIFVGHFEDFDRNRLSEALETLRGATTNDPETIKTLLQGVVPTYLPTK